MCCKYCGAKSVITERGILICFVCLRPVKDKNEN